MHDRTLRGAKVLSPKSQNRDQDVENVDKVLSKSWVETRDREYAEYGITYNYYCMVYTLYDYTRRCGPVMRHLQLINVVAAPTINYVVKPVDPPKKNPWHPVNLLRPYTIQIYKFINCFTFINLLFFVK